MINKLLPLLLTFCLFIFSFSQTLGEKQYKDMIYNVRFSKANGTEIKKIDSIIRICENSDYEECTALGYLKMANIYNKNNNIERAFNYSNKVEKLITSTTDIEIVFYLRALQFGLLMKLGKRMDALAKLDEIPARVKENPYFGYLLNGYYGDFYNDTGDKEQALKAYKNAYKLAKIFRSNSKKYISNASKDKISNSYIPTASLAGVYLDLGKTDSAKIYIEEALNNAKKINEVQNTYYTFLYAARYYQIIKSYEKAQQFLWTCKYIAGKYYKTEGHVKSVNNSLLLLYKEMNIKDSINYYSTLLLAEATTNNKQTKNLNDVIDKKRNNEETVQRNTTNKLK
jgi:tetratricopeptide (TPR) repeat protein